VPIAQLYELKKLVLASSVCPFDEWFETLSIIDQVMVDDRLARVRQGSFGEINCIGAGVWEFKFRKGPAFRVYYGQIGRQILILLVGGEKSSQKGDIAKAIELFLLFKDGGAHHENS